jgi:hypothetical protein
MSIDYTKFAKNKYFQDQKLSSPSDEKLLKIGNQLFHAFKLYLYGYKSDKYNKMFSNSQHHPEEDFTKGEKNYYSSIITNTDECKKWLAMQMFYFLNFVPENEITCMFDDGINFFNWITNRKIKMNDHFEPSFNELMNLFYGGNYVAKYHKYLKKNKN